MDQRICIKFCVKNKIKCADAFRMLTVAYGETTLDRSNVYRWYKMFSEGREDVNDEERYLKHLTVLDIFKKSHRIVSRKITKFVTRRTIEDSIELQNIANDFLKTVKPLIEQFGSEIVFNSDQSGFQLEIHSGRSLCNEGVKKIECVVQSISSTAHSYTIQPIISCNGNLLSPLSIVLKETNLEKDYFLNIDSKILLKRFSDILLLLESNINLHEQNNIIKLQSLIYNQLSSSRYHNLFKYSWFKSDYTNGGPELISDDTRLRKLASIVSVSESTMRRIAEEDFRYKSGYLSFYSNHSPYHKIGTIYSLVDGTILLSNSTFYNKNIKFIIDNLKDNSYPLGMIFYYINKRIKSLACKKSDGKITKSINKSKNMIGCRCLKLNKFIKVHKDKNQHDKNNNVIYKMNCNNCDASYVGQTKRNGLNLIKGTKLLDNSYFNILDDVLEL
ncbi:GVQW3 protein, partial [Acromyrmex insinuator]